MSEQEPSKITPVKEIIFLGDVCTGKTSIINRILNSSFNEKSQEIKNIKIRNENFKIKIWDTTVQEKYKILFPSSLKTSSIIFLVYDVSKESSFNNIKNWINFICSEKYSEKPIIVLCGNKIDLKREVKKIDGDELAKKFGYLFFECSAKTNENIKYMFYSSILNLPIFRIKNEKEKEILIKKLIEEDKKEKQDDSSSIMNIINNINNKINKKNIKITNLEKEKNQLQKEYNEKIELLKIKENEINKLNKIIEKYKQNKEKPSYQKIEIKSEQNKELISQKDKIINSLIKKINNLIKEQNKKREFQNNSSDILENIINILKNELSETQGEIIPELTELENQLKEIKEINIRTNENYQNLIKANLELKREIKEKENIISEYSNHFKILNEKIQSLEIKNEELKKSFENNNIKKELEENQEKLYEKYENIKEKLNEELMFVKEELKKEKKKFEELDSIINASIINESILNNNNNNNIYNDNNKDNKENNHKKNDENNDSESFYLLIKENDSQLNEISSINNTNNLEYSYECLNKKNLEVDIYEGLDSVEFQIELKNNGKKKWPKNSKLSICDGSDILVNDIILEQQNPGEITKYKVYIDDLRLRETKEYKIFCCDGKSYGEQLELKINIKELY